MSTVRFIGDVHGHIERYLRIIEDAEESYQIGDMGIGFPGVLFPPPTMNHRFIRGNHDHPRRCTQVPNWIPDGYFDKQKSMFFCGGASSIDKNYRTEGRDWWPEEELSMLELYGAMKVYEKNKPRIVVTHEIADSIATRLFSFKQVWETNRTRQAFDALLQIHTPEVWIFGHWHESRDETINGTRFICLKELEYIDLQIT
jgi:predicted phosphodiesterase